MSRHSPSMSIRNASRQASSCGESTRTPSTSKIAPWYAMTVTSPPVATGAGHPIASPPRTLGRRPLDGDGGPGAEQVRLAADGDLQRRPLVEEVALLVVGQLHPDLPVTEPQRECQCVPDLRQGGRKRQAAVEGANAAKPKDQRRPHAGGRRDLDAIRDVTGDVGQVHEQRKVEVLDRLELATDLGGEDALHACRQRGVTRGERIVIVEVAPLLLLGELVA